jgi:hypothetical protein
VRVAAWRVADTGLVAAPGRFRRLPGIVRHHRGTDPAWPTEVVLELRDGELRVTAGDAVVGAWSSAEVELRRLSAGPPVQFVLELPGQAQLLAAAGGPDTEALLTALSS